MGLTKVQHSIFFKKQSQITSFSKIFWVQLSSNGQNKCDEWLVSLYIWACKVVTLCQKTILSSCFGWQSRTGSVYCGNRHQPPWNLKYKLPLWFVFIQHLRLLTWTWRYSGSPVPLQQIVDCFQLSNLLVFISCFVFLPSLGRKSDRSGPKWLQLKLFLWQTEVSKPEEGSCSLVWWYRTRTEFTPVHHRHITLVKLTVANGHITSLLCIRQTAPVLTLRAALVCWHERISHDHEKACTIPGQWNWSSSEVARTTSCSILSHTANKQDNKKCCADLSPDQLWDIYSSDWISCWKPFSMSLFFFLI